MNRYKTQHEKSLSSSFENQKFLVYHSYGSVGLGNRLLSLTSSFMLAVCFHHPCIGK